MNKYTIAGAVLGAGILLSPLAAFASVDNVLFNNGSTGSVTAQAGATIPMDILVSSTGTDVDSVWVNFPGAGGSAQVGRCYDITPNQIGSSPAGGWTVHVDLDRTPLNANLWDMTVSTYGLDAVDAEDNTCSTGVDFTHTFSGNDRRVTITNSTSVGTGSNNSGGSGSNGSGGNSNTPPAWFTAWLATQQGNSTGGTMNAAKCATVSPYRSAPAYTYSTMGQQLQSALMVDNPHSIPALDASLHQTGTVPLGFNGIQTHAALAAFDSQYHCI